MGMNSLISKDHKYTNKAQCVWPRKNVVERKDLGSEREREKR